jgi:hypothetical protein
MAVSIVWRCGFKGAVRASKYSASLPKTKSGGVMAFKCWLLTVLGDRLVQAVWGMAPNNGVRFNQN